MDTEAQHVERDRSSQPDEHASEGEEDRSRSSLLSRAVAAAADWLPGGRITLALLTGLVLLLAFSVFVMQPFQIPSGSMESTLRVGDRVLVNKLAYRFGAEPKRGDVVVFDGDGYFGDADYIKRVVGVGGDHVVCCDSKGRIEVNGQSVDERSLLYAGDAPSEAAFDIKVPDGTLFLLGDHRSDSRDSRDLMGAPGGGFLPLDHVIGKAEWVAWPSGHWRSLSRADVYARVPAPGGLHG
ncbi:signal peptidase I [Streptomyces sp. VRA16 Mangrove soil]|uniref:signal peptidase I n=1 Tax=Streptomyces sp. VRA16 Mangrove soil TaxID=2817434 RepID=UPI001A9EA45D|nr:signal peptidase I [Streptomyces sp. VRA16 Mangrove soil]MBO1335938.1 signal peptidase I [Streptomyces sp. VRA16 Mangrove soil]